MKTLEPPEQSASVLLTLARAFMQTVGMPRLVSAPPEEISSSAEARIRKAETRYQTLVEKVPAITFIVSFENRASEIYVSPHIESVLGYTAAEWVDDPILWYQRLHVEDRERWNHEFSQTLCYGEPFKGDYRFLAKDGHEVWIHGEVTVERNALGQPSFLQGLGYDITELKRVQAEVRQAKDYAESIINSAPILICGLQPDGTTRFVNPAAEEICGYQASEMLGRNWWTLLYPGETRAEGEALRAEFRLGRVVNRESTLTRRDGEKRIVSWNFVNLRGEAIGIGLDVTARHRAEENRARLEGQLHQSQRTEALGTLARGIAHDFNNILGTIVMMTDLVKDDVPPDGQARRNLDAVLNAAHRATDLVQQIMAFSRGIQAERSFVHLTPLIHEAAALVQAGLPPSVKLEVAITAQRDGVQTNAVQIHQILMNLCGNAEHAMRGRDGRLRVTLDEVSVGYPPEPEGPQVDAGTYLRLSVEDTGHGMAPAVLKRIFDPFFTTKKVGEGTGLGLSVVHGIVKNNGGDICVKSEVGRGTSFQVFLPLASEPPNV